MNCLEFRRTLATEPARADAALERHERSCASCAEFALEMRALDRRIEQALRVPVPERAGRIRALGFGGQIQRPWALAASVLVAVVAASLVWLAYPRATLADDVVTHARHEPQSWAETAAEIPRSALAYTLRDSGFAGDAGLGRVSYARSCWFRGHFVPHLVVQDESGPVMVLVLTEEKVSARTAFAEEGFSGELLPARRGSIAVLAPAGTRVDAVAARVLEALR